MVEKAGDLMLKCENSLCIYQENGACALDSVTLDEGGRCGDCILVNIDKQTLESEKIKALQQLHTQSNGTYFE